MTLTKKIGAALLALAAAAPLARAADPVRYTADDGWVLGEIVKIKGNDYERTPLPAPRSLVPGETIAQVLFRHKYDGPTEINDRKWGAVLQFGGLSFPKGNGQASYFIDLSCNNYPGDQTGSSTTITKEFPLYGRAFIPLNCPLMPPWVAQPRQSIVLRTTGVDEKTGATVFEAQILPMYVEEPKR